MSVLEQIERFGDERGGVRFCDLVDYARKNNANWMRYMGGKGLVLVLELLRRKGWDATVTEESVDDGIGWVAERYGMSAANNIAHKVYAVRWE